MKIELLAEGIYRFNGCLWHRAKVRKPQPCWLCEVDFARGTVMLRPVSNGYHRMRRICVDCAAKATS